MRVEIFVNLFLERGCLGLLKIVYLWSGGLKNKKGNLEKNFKIFNFVLL